MRVKPLAGLVLKAENGRLILLDIDRTSHATKIPSWRSRIRRAWIIPVNGVTVSICDELDALIRDAPRENVTLLFAHSEVQHGLNTVMMVFLWLIQIN